MRGQRGIKNKLPLIVGEYLKGTQSIADRRAAEPVALPSVRLPRVQTPTHTYTSVNGCGLCTAHIGYLPRTTQVSWMSYGQKVCNIYSQLHGNMPDKTL